MTHGEELAWLSFATPDPYNICSRPQAGLKCRIAFVCFDLTHVIHDFAKSINSHGLNPDSRCTADQRADCVAVEFDVPWVNHGDASSSSASSMRRQIHLRNTPLKSFKELRPWLGLRLQVSKIDLRTGCHASRSNLYYQHDRHCRELSTPCKAHYALFFASFFSQSFLRSRRITRSESSSRYTCC